MTRACGSAWDKYIAREVKHNKTAQLPESTVVRRSLDTLTRADSARYRRPDHD